MPGCVVDTRVCLLPPSSLLLTSWFFFWFFLSLSHPHPWHFINCCTLFIALYNISLFCISPPYQEKYLRQSESASGSESIRLWSGLTMSSGIYWDFNMSLWFLVCLSKVLAVRVLQKHDTVHQLYISVRSRASSPEDRLRRRHLATHLATHRDQQLICRILYNEL